MASSRNKSYDYIVVGGGSAGCVAGSRLVRDFGARVLILEAGGQYKDWILKVPAGFSKILDGDRFLTQHQTIPQHQLGGRVQIIPQGKVLGGGSSINAQGYMRGRVADYDIWGTMTGSDLWSWQKMLPHFTRMESNQKFNNPLHGITGPLLVSDPGFICEMSHIYVKTLQGMGMPLTPDFNNGAPAGVGYLQLTAGGTPRRRCSAVDAFLAPLAGHPNLTIVTGAQVERIVIEKGRAVGVHYVEANRRRSASTDGEVLLAAGAFVSPQLLMLSGVGAADELRAHGVSVTADVPGVGRNLQDHAGAPVAAEAPGRLGYFKQDVGIGMLANGLEYLLFGHGRVATNGVEACSYHVPEDGIGDPVVQIYCVPKTSYIDKDVRGVPDIDGITLHAVLLRPKSVGWLKLRSADPRDRPLINPNYLAHTDDIRHLREGIRVARKILAAHPLSDIVRREILPGPDVQDDAAIEEHLRRTVKTDYHPVGTCKMGGDSDRNAVVGPDLRVRGVEGLRVIDASVMPKLVSANTNAPTMALADRAIDIICGRAH
jgi:choline dehydrogenase